MNIKDILTICVYYPQVTGSITKILPRGINFLTFNSGLYDFVWHSDVTNTTNICKKCKNSLRLISNRACRSNLIIRW